MNVTEQLPEMSVQVLELKVPGALVVNVIVPDGVIMVPSEVSDTVAVQVEAELVGTEEGTQLMLVEVERWVTLRLKLPELVLSLESPL